jgi:predicted trehalose synthase
VEEIAITGHEDEAATDLFAPYASFATATGRRLREPPEGLLAGVAEPCRAVRNLAAERRGALRTRVHGDLYPGQVVAWRDSRS